MKEIQKKRKPLLFPATFVSHFNLHWLQIRFFLHSSSLARNWSLCSLLVPKEWERERFGAQSLQMLPASFILSFSFPIFSPLFPDRNNPRPYRTFAPRSIICKKKKVIPRESENLTVPSIKIGVGGFKERENLKRESGHNALASEKKMDVRHVIPSLGPISSILLSFRNREEFRQQTKEEKGPFEE